MSAIVMRRTIQGLAPVDQASWDLLAGDRIRIGDDVMCNITKPRNLKFHRLFFAMIHATFEMQDEYETHEQWRAVVTAGAGYCDFIESKENQLVAVPKSIAFGRMDETQFAKLYQDVLTFICARYVDDTPERLATILEFT